ncbi:MAG: YqhA family protein [Muribaculaceae bacterium]|nr:YqhA family protein [Muribaculaceae bacterium]
MKKLLDLRGKIRRSKTLSPDALQELKDIFADLKEINDDDAEALFKIKDLENVKLPHDYKNFFANTLADYLLDYRGNEQNRLDKDGIRWLKSRVLKHDEYDEALLEELENRLEALGENLPNSLKKKNFWIIKFENILYFSRYIAIVSVIGAILSSIILFIQGFGLIIRGLVGFFMDPYERYEVLFEQLVSSVDVFLFALVLIIFGVGVYELFIANVDPEEKPADMRPAWLKISSVDDLKSSLGKVILMVLIVSFFKHVLEIDSEHWTPISLLYLAVGILLIAGALYLTHKSNAEGEHKLKEEKESPHSKEIIEETLS